MDRGTWWAAVHGVTKLDLTEQLSMHILSLVLCDLAIYMSIYFFLFLNILGTRLHLTVFHFWLPRLFTCCWRSKGREVPLNFFFLGTNQYYYFLLWYARRVISFCDIPAQNAPLDAFRECPDEEKSGKIKLRDTKQAYSPWKCQSQGI